MDLERYRAHSSVPFEQDGPDEAGDGGLVWEDADALGAALALAFEGFARGFKGCRRQRWGDTPPIRVRRRRVGPMPA